MHMKFTGNVLCLTCGNIIRLVKVEKGSEVGCPFCKSWMKVTGIDPIVLEPLIVGKKGSRA